MSGCNLRLIFVSFRIILSKTVWSWGSLWTNNTSWWTKEKVILFKYFVNVCIQIIKEYINYSYDFIVIGAGSGGATLAARLSEEKCFSVLLLETGLDEISWGRVPALPIASTSLNWQHRGETETNSCLNRKENRCIFCGGKVIVSKILFFCLQSVVLDYRNISKLYLLSWRFLSC